MTQEKQNRTYDKATGVVTWTVPAGAGSDSVYDYAGTAHQWVPAPTIRKACEQCSVVETRDNGDFVEIDTRALWDILTPLINAKRAKVDRAQNLKLRRQARRDGDDYMVRIYDEILAE